MRMLLCLLGAASLCAWADDAATVFERARSSVVSVVALDEKDEPHGEGSGVIIAAGQVVTNCHVVAEANSIQVKAGERVLKAQILAADAERDVCSLKVEGLSAAPVKLRSFSELQTGERVYAIGNPLGFELSVSSGLISALIPSEQRIISTAPVSPGSSGGGLFDAQARLVGITTAILVYGQNVNIAAPTDWIAQLPRRHRPLSAPTSSAGTDPDWYEHAESLRKSKRWADLLQHTTQWREAYPTSGDAKAFAALALINLDRPADARTLLLRSVREHPNDATMRSYLGLARQKLGDEKGAIADYEAAITLMPAGYFPRLTLAEMHRDAGRLHVALEKIKQALQLAPGDAGSWAVMGDIQLHRKDLSEAVRAYQTALKLDASLGRVRTNLAIAQARSGQSGEAKQTLGTSANPSDDADTWIAIGASEEQKQRYGEAEKAYRKALELAPNSSLAWLQLGRSLARTNRKNDAEQALRNAIKHDPKTAQPWLFLGALQQERGELQSALESYQRATRLDAQLANAWRGQAHLLRERKDLRAAVPALQKVVELEPQAAAEWSALGDALIKLGRVDEAKAALDRAEKLAPKEPMTLHALATYYGMRGDHPKSLSYTEQAIEINAADATSWSNKGYSLIKLKRPAEAVEALQTAVRLEPEHSTAWINLGEALMHTKQAGKAIAALQKALQLVPDAPDARLYIAQAFLVTGQSGKAKAHLDHALQKHPNFADGWFTLAVLHLTLGQHKETLDAYNRLKALHPAKASLFKERTRSLPSSRDIVLPD